ncbi:hypothetical protein QYF36_012529 [Acer negundo]|nr:hypothetical protein QYF36_012529 [Acer negundo]
MLLNDSDSDINVEEHNGLSMMKLNLGPKKKLLVLSLGVYKRPYCTDFIKFCLERLEVGIWSSAREWYMSNALDCITVGLRSKVLFAWPNTAVFPTDEYKANHVNDDALGPKGELRKYLEGLVDAYDVPSYVKNHTFGQSAITCKHPDRDFYSQIMYFVTARTSLHLNRWLKKKH